MIRGTSGIKLLSPFFDLADRIQVNTERSLACNPSLGFVKGKDSYGVRFAS